MTVRGNHDHGVAQNVPVFGRNGYKYLTGVTRPLSPSARPRRTPLPRQTAGQPSADPGQDALLPRPCLAAHPLDEYAPPDVEFWQRRLQNVDADVICVGHTHQPYVLEVGDKLVINPGSVGQPRDGDPRASYAIVENFKVDLRRVEYAVEETVKTIEQSSLPDAAKARLSEAFRNGGLRGGSVPP